MARYRTRSHTVEAVQWQPGVSVPDLKQVDAAKGSDGSLWPAYGILVTDGRGRHVRPGDWIISHGSGLREICPPEDFARRYEAVDEPPKE